MNELNVDMDELELLAFRAEQLSSMAKAFQDALENGYNTAKAYLYGLDLFTTLLHEHANNMNALFDKADSARREAGAA